MHIYYIDEVLQVSINKKNNLDNTQKGSRIYPNVYITNLDLLRHLLKLDTNKPYAKAWLPMLETGQLNHISLTILIEPTINFQSIL